ncbi:MAG: nucleotidyltransferase family protein [Saprospiraceae bacterium]
MQSAQEIKTTLQSAKPLLMARYPIESMALFGSYARGEATEQSDVDILVEFNGSIGWQFLTLADELEQMLGLKVDLVSRQGVKPRYFEVIQKDLIYV